MALLELLIGSLGDVEPLGAEVVPWKMVLQGYSALSVQLFCFLPGPLICEQAVSCFF